MGRLIDADILERSLTEIDEHINMDIFTNEVRKLIDNAPTVQAIPKDQYEARLKENNRLVNDLEELRTMINKFAESYENRLKADMVAMLTEIQLEIEELPKIHPFIDYPDDNGYIEDSDIKDLIQQKINNLQVNNSKVKEQDDGTNSN